MNKICFFTSIGEDLSLIDFVKKNYKYDIVANYYGDKEQTYNQIQKKTKYSINFKLSKFQAAYKMREILEQYDYIFIFDDDAIITKGSLEKLIEIITDHKLDIVAPAQDPAGRISFKLHLPKNGDHVFRKVNFVEVNFVVFSKKAFTEFMPVYKGYLIDWGIDHLYSSMFERIGIVDEVVILNPKNSTKMKNFSKIPERITQWKAYKAQNNLNNIIPKTMEFYTRTARIG